MNPVIKYFSGERLECLIAVALGVALLVAAFYFFIYGKRPFFSGMALSFLLASIQVVVCSAVYFRDAEHMARVNQVIEADRSKIRVEEVPRMEQVMKTFRLSRWIEMGVLFIGLILAFTMPDRSLWQGIGAGLCLVSIQLLALDFFDERRGNDYLHYLKSLG